MSRKRFPRSRGSVGNEPPAYLRDTFFSVRAARLGISLISCAVSRVKGFKEPGMGAKNRKEFRGNVYFLRFFDGMEEREREREYNYNIRTNYIRVIFEKQSSFLFFKTWKKFIDTFLLHSRYVFVIYITKMKLETRFYFSFQLLWIISSVQCI